MEFGQLPEFHAVMSARRPRRRQDRRRSPRQCAACRRAFGTSQAQTVVAAIQGKTQGACACEREPSDKITMAALFPRYVAFLRAGDTVVLETGSSSLGVAPTILPDGVRVEA